MDPNNLVIIEYKGKNYNDNLNSLTLTLNRKT